jgi:nucleoside-diphosphate-sugar epimerase
VVRLVDQGCEVTVLHRGETEPADLPAIEHIHADRQALGAVRDVIAVRKPDVVLDMVPMTEADARGVIDVVGDIARRTVAISSQDVYRAYDVVRRHDDGPPQLLPLTESSELRQGRFPYRRDVAPDHPLHDYDKIPVEEVYLDESPIPGTVLRLPAVYGPRDAQHRTAPYLRRMLDARPAIVLSERLAEWRWTRAYVEDVAAAIALAVMDDGAAGRVYNIGERRALSEREWIEAIGRAAGWSGDIRIVPDDVLPGDLRAGVNPAQSLVVDSSSIRGELGYAEVVAPEVAMERTVQWESAQPHGDAIDYADEDAILEP